MGQGFTYDGFGNLTGKSVTKGSAPYLSVGVDATTNRIVGYQYDANGNQTWSNTQTLSYDYDNRMVNADNRNYTGSQYGYDPDNKRVYTADWTYDYNTSLTTVSNEVVYFFGVTGQRMAAYTLVAYASPPTVSMTRSNDRVYFGGKLIRGDSGQWADPDRLGSVGTYFPYGENRNGGGGMFATYTRDGSGLDYADQRFYWSNLGRFTSPDPYRANSAIPDSAQWNRYAYVGSDPVTYIDPRGLFMVPPPSSQEPDPEPQQQSPFPGPQLPQGPVPSDPPPVRGNAIASRAKQLAKKWLANADCKGLFNTSGNGADPEFALSSLIASGSFSTGSSQIRMFSFDFGTSAARRLHFSEHNSWFGKSKYWGRHLFEHKWVR